MNAGAPDPNVAQALAVSRLRAWRTALVDLHKLAIDEERRRYEREHGPIDGPHHAWQLVLRDPWFSWLRPLADRILALDERLADKRPIAVSELDTAAAEIRGLVRGDQSPAFIAPYRRALQDVPDIVIAHGRLLGLLEDFGLPPEIRRAAPPRPATGPQ